ncbi:hypothetical protein GCM10025870_32700 [Agromyces marinus]|uniref:Alpha-1,4-glucan:maltose-1-phosphate maltosyltransferase domain-containing protein n=1 Tax=Agromyces marinus TaxID=1389020 RepID=A0ABM8H5T7_9MICO|nr:hypothetical protein GCM10025870_32700 [Agromyces marinus]
MHEVAQRRRARGGAKATHTRRRNRAARIGRDRAHDLPLAPHPRYGRNVTRRPAPAGRIPVTRLTPATPDPRWNAKAFAGEVVPFGATVFREGHDRVGAMLVLTGPGGTTQRHRMLAGAPGTDRWEAQVRLDEVGVWRWHVTGFGDEIATWAHDAAVKVDAGVDVDLMYEIGARLAERAAAETDRTAAVRKRLAAWAAALRRRMPRHPLDGP